MRKEGVLRHMKKTKTEVGALMLPRPTGSRPRERQEIDWQYNMLMAWSFKWIGKKWKKKSR